ncbi:hypothetical protein Tco_1391806 [Tanacetum coccineum]
MSTAPTSRYEVGESSTTAPRPTRGHRADYGFIDTMDAKIRRSCQGGGSRTDFRHFRLEIRLMQMISRALNNMPPRRTSAATARVVAVAVAAALMTAAVVEQLIEARVSATLANHETL